MYAPLGADDRTDVLLFWYAGGNVSAAVDERGELWVWGSNVDGLLCCPAEG